MAVTTTYDIRNVKSEFVVTYSAIAGTPTDERNPTLVALADGGFALAYERQSQDATYRSSIFLERYTVGGAFRPGPDFVGTTQLSVAAEGNTDVDPAITVVADGRILTTWTQTGSDPGIHFSEVDPDTGALTAVNILLPETNSGSVFSDVVAIAGGGFAVVRQDPFLPNDEDADLLICRPNGSLLIAKALGANSSLDEQDPAVAVLNNGNIVVAYEKEKVDDSNTFGMAVEIFTPTGTAVLAPFTFDTTGDQNRAPEVVALKDGGFAVVYQDDQYGTVKVTICFFTEAGVLRGGFAASVSAGNKLDPAASVLANGFVAITWTDTFFAGDTDVQGVVIDPVSMTRVSDLFLDNQAGNQSQSSIIALANGRFVTAWTDENSAITDGNTDPNGSHVSLQIDALVRTSTGNEADDTIIGDSLMDTMFGTGGADVMYGFGGSDILDDGGADALGVRDVMYGGVGNDVYYVWNTLSSAQDIVFENNASSGAQGGSSIDVDTIVSTGEFFRDFYSVAEILAIVETANTTFATTYLVGGANSNATIYGNAGSNIISTYGGSKTVNAGAGTDAISFSLYDLAQSFNGVNTLGSTPGTGIDYLYGFETNIDKVDLRAYNFGITGQQVLAQGVNVFGSDPNSSADDYCYFYLTNAGGVDNYVAFVGLTTAQLHAADFITS